MSLCSDIFYNINTIPDSIRRVERRLRHLKHKQDEKSVKEYNQLARTYNRFEKRRLRIYNEYKRVRAMEEGSCVRIEGFMNLNKACESYVTDYFESGDMKNYDKFEWSSLIKKNIEPEYSEHGKKGERALDRALNPEKYYWNRNRDKEGRGVPAGYTAAMRDMQNIKPFNTKKSVGASSYPNSPVKFR